MIDSSDPPPTNADLLARLAALEAAAHQTAEVLSANVRAVETIGQRFYALTHRLNAVERALARQAGTDG